MKKGPGVDAAEFCVGIFAVKIDLTCGGWATKIETECKATLWDLEST